MIEKKQDILSLKQFSQKDILSLMNITAQFEKSPQSELLKGKIIALMFLEPSTRTRLSFTSAAQRLGAEIMTYESAVGSSFSKGETLRDTVKMLESYADLIVVRHPNEGAVRFIAENVSIPVINAGDGSNQHPTQTLLDMYTIYKHKKSFDNLNIGFLGDLKYGRTTHSLLEGLSNFNVKLNFIAPDILQMPQNYLDYLKSKNINFSLSQEYKTIINDLDVLYVTRIQRERFIDENDYEKVKNVYTIHAKDLENVKKDLMIMHPLPRVNEIHTSVDQTPHAFYFEQAANGVYARQMLLSLCLNKVTM